jgi:hypothetical protein
MEIKVPFLNESIGAGDLVKAATTAVGVKPCPPCQKRAEALNRILRFTPRWTAPPHVPEGWRLHKECSGPFKIIRLFFNEKTGESVILDIVGGKYANYRKFCCETLRDRAEEKWEEACRSL